MVNNTCFPGFKAKVRNGGSCFTWMKNHFSKGVNIMIQS